MTPIFSKAARSPITAGGLTNMRKQRARGAWAAILIHKTEMASYPWEVVRNSWGGESSLSQDDKIPSSNRRAGSNLKWRANWRRPPAMDLEQMMKVANSRSFKPMDLGEVERNHCEQRTAISSRNVIGKVIGSDEKLKSGRDVYGAL